MSRTTRRLRGLDRALAAFEAAAVGGLLAAVFLVVLLQVLMRYLFAQPNPWSEELSRFCFLWASLLGASLAVERRAHFGFDRVVGRLPRRAKRAVEAVSGAVVLAVALLLVGAGAALVKLAIGQTSPALDLPVALFYAAAPVSGAFMTVHLLAPRRAAPEAPEPGGG